MADERAEAVEHLDFAIREFQDMKMQPSLERALRHRSKVVVDFRAFEYLALQTRSTAT